MRSYAGFAHPVILVHMDDPTPSAPKPRTYIGWRLLALLYDLWPVVATWMLITVPFTLGYTFLGGHDPHENIAPFSLLGWALWLTCAVATGLYAVISWRRGGQTLGMRPWRIKVVGMDGTVPSWRALIVRYLVAIASTLAAGLGFWWAWVDQERLTWHDRASGTRMIRLPKNKA